MSQLASNANNYQSKLLLYMCRGVHPSEAMMHICLCLRFPPIFDKFSDSVENFRNVTFSRKYFRFSSGKISDDLFFVIDQKCRIFPCFSTFPLLFRESYYFSATFKNFLPVFRKFTSLLHTLCVFRFPLTLTMMHLCITQCTYWTPLYMCRIREIKLVLSLRGC